MNIIKPSTPMRSEANNGSALETECLFGETVELLDNAFEWNYCKLLTDNYYGWVKKKDLGYLPVSTHRVISTRSFLYERKDAKSPCIHYLPLGAQVSVQLIKDGWAEVILCRSSNNNKFAYTPSNHIVEKGNKFQNWVSIAEKLISTPYKWGGRDSIGLDCSALLQLSIQTFGYHLPRNTIDQMALQKEIIIDTNKLCRGCVIFWKGHVCIMVDKLNCIHANAFHMQTKVEPLNDVLFRMKKEYPIVKMMNFN